MIAEGVVLAYRELAVKVPVVVRLRGTNEGVGQRMVSFIFSGFVVELEGGVGVEAGCGNCADVGGG